MSEKKTLFEDEKRCPHCRKFIVVKRIKQIITPAVSAEVEFTTRFEKSIQTRLKGEE